MVNKKIVTIFLLLFLITSTISCVYADDDDRSVTSVFIYTDLLAVDTFPGKSPGADGSFSGAGAGIHIFCAYEKHWTHCSGRNHSVYMGFRQQKYRPPEKNIAGIGGACVSVPFGPSHEKCADWTALPYSFQWGTQL